MLNGDADGDSVGTCKLTFKKGLQKPCCMFIDDTRFIVIILSRGVRWKQLPNVLELISLKFRSSQ